MNISVYVIYFIIKHDVIINNVGSVAFDICKHDPRWSDMRILLGFIIYVSILVLMYGGGECTPDLVSDFQSALTALLDLKPT